MDSSKLATFFHSSLFIPHIEARNKAQLLEEMVQLLADTGVVKNKRIVLETLTKRETLGSTGIGKGVAVPHCRTLAVKKVSIVFGISGDGIPFNAIDGKKAYLFFLIVAPPQEEVNVYLPILGMIVEMVRNAKIRRSLKKAKDFETLIDIVRGD